MAAEEMRHKPGIKPGETIIFRLVEDRVELDRAPMNLDDVFRSVSPRGTPE